MSVPRPCEKWKRSRNVLSWRGRKHSVSKKSTDGLRHCSPTSSVSKLVRLLKPNRRLLPPRQKRTMLLTSTRQRLIPKRHEVRHRERRLHQAGQRLQTIMLRQERTTAPTTTSSVHGTRMDANTSSERQQLRRLLPNSTAHSRRPMSPPQVRLTARPTASPPLPTRRKVVMPSA